MDVQFFFKIPYVASQPLKPVFSMPVLWAALLNAPCVVNWGDLVQINSKKNETQSKRVQSSFTTYFLDFRVDAEVTLKWNALYSFV